MSDHDALERRLGELLRTADPVPEVVLEAGRAALGWRRLDAELAELLSDSALDSEQLALTRSAQADLRSVTFSTRRHTIDLDVTRVGERRVLRGQISPPAAFTVEVQRADTTTIASVECDRLGRFVAEIEDAGTVRLRLSGDPEGRAIETSWITV